MKLTKVKHLAQCLFHSDSLINTSCCYYYHQYYLITEVTQNKIYNGHEFYPAILDVKKKKKLLSSVSLNQIPYVQKPSHYEGSNPLLLLNPATNLRLHHISSGAYGIGNIFRKPDFSCSALLKSPNGNSITSMQISLNFPACDVSYQFLPSPQSLLQCPTLLLMTLHVEAE